MLRQSNPAETSNVKRKLHAMSKILSGILYELKRIEMRE